MRRGSAGLAIGLVLLATTAYVALIGSAPAEAIEAKDAAQQLFALTNLDRTSNGLPALARDNRLSTVAVARSQDMITRDYFSHQIPPDGHTVVDTLESLGVPFRAAGENIAWNTATDFATVDAASQDFNNSPHHRENLLDKRWDRMGTGVADGGGKKMYTVVFMATRPPGETSGGGPAAEPTVPPAPPRVHGERVEVASVPTGFITSLVNTMVRLFLNL
jgi:uncharacterized protein YkwD